MELNEKVHKKDIALETNIAKLNSVEEQLEDTKSKTQKTGEKLIEAEEGIKLLHKLLRKYMNKTESPPKPAANDDENRKLMELLKQKNGDALTDRCTKPHK